jgi:hypothetical protein
VKEQQQNDGSPANEFNIKDILEATAPAALATAALAGLSARAQTRENTRKAEHDHSASDPGPESKALHALNPSSKPRVVKILERADRTRFLTFSIMDIEDEGNHMGASVGLRYWVSQSGTPAAQ